ncbi:Putative Mitochondrial tricarboxylate/dicarboxylate carrier proteins [Aspergillus calidoustus]|uniref:Putative Mitochondrial tricarboxylate/dicarboxylate carrier proteins n=1 Tax=Aspergillus calidoustus TaxID=454130 RepID=A0A0U5GUG1_ASPCI|nr:Putative Mitochondrial tricarboxylate/dicarboxylate carrier proteins [Aspergillus calidoustus]
MASIAENKLPSVALTTQNHPQAKPKRAISPGVSLTAGAVAGAVEAAITYPFEFAKTRAQLNRNRVGVSSAPISKNPFAVISQTARQDGIRAIYTGCSTLILGTACKAGVRFLSFDSIKNILADADGRLSPARGILAGMLAGAVESAVAVTPTERIKTALIDDSRSPNGRRYKDGLHALRTIVAESGVKEVYRGLLSTTLKQSTTSAVRMGSYNVIKEAVSSRTSAASTSNPVLTFGMGATAGVVTVYMTQPFDTIKTRAQGAKGVSTVEAFRAVLADGGVRAFWRGSSMRLGRLILSGGIVFTVYENVAALLSPGIQRLG